LAKASPRIKALNLQAGTPDVTVSDLASAFSDARTAQRSNSKVGQFEQGVLLQIWIQFQPFQQYF